MFQGEGCIFLQESSGFWCFPFLWQFFHRNHDSCFAVAFLKPPQESCLYGAYVRTYIGIKKELYPSCRCLSCRCAATVSILLLPKLPLCCHRRQCHALAKLPPLPPSWPPPPRCHHASATAAAAAVATAIAFVSSLLSSLPFSSPFLLLLLFDC